MNIAEKRRAEDMVHTWRKARRIVEHDPEPPMSVVKTIDALHAALSRARHAAAAAGFDVKCNAYASGEAPFSLVVSVSSPEIKKLAAKYDAERKALNDRCDSLIAKIWNNEFTFAQLHAELADE